MHHEGWCGHKLVLILRRWYFFSPSRLTLEPGEDMTENQSSWQLVVTMTLVLASSYCTQTLSSNKIWRAMLYIYCTYSFVHTFSVNLSLEVEKWLYSWTTLPKRGSSTRVRIDSNKSISCSGAQNNHWGFASRNFTSSGSGACICISVKRMKWLTDLLFHIHVAVILSGPTLEKRMRDWSSQ